MQTTLLGIAIALILALIAALVGPHFVDWNQYRPQFEAEASRLVGAPVRVGGAIDVRLLPTPTLLMNGVEIGPRGEDALRVRALGIEFALGALVRGQLRASQTRISGPQLTVALGADGRATLPSGGLGFDGATLAVDHLHVEDARLTLAHAASQSRIMLDKLWFDGEVRSLTGSFRGEGAFIADKQLYGYRVNATRLDNGAIRLRFNLDPSERALAAEGDGVVTLDGNAPKFDGGVTFIRPAGTVLASGRAVVNEPWRLTSRVKAGAASALFEQIEFQYGPEERALKIGGTAELKFSVRSRLDGVLSATQLDIDRLIAATGQGAKRTPLAAVRAFVDSFGGALAAPLPMKIAFSADSVTLGGAPLQNLRGDLVSDGGDVSFESASVPRARLHRGDLQRQGRVHAGRPDIHRSRRRCIHRSAAPAALARGPRRHPARGRRQGNAAARRRGARAREDRARKIEGGSRSQERRRPARLSMADRQTQGAPRCRR